MSVRIRIADLRHQIEDLPDDVQFEIIGELDFEPDGERRERTHFVSSRDEQRQGRKGTPSKRLMLDRLAGHNDEDFVTFHGSFKAIYMDRFDPDHPVPVEEYIARTL